MPRDQRRIMNHEVKKHGYSESGVQRVGVRLNKGRVSDVLRVFNGPVLVHAMFLEITETVANTACNLSWVLRSDLGGYRVIADTVNIQAAAKGDFYWAELDGTNLVKATTSTGLIHGGFREGLSGMGTILPPGGVDFVLSTNNLASGAGTLTLFYRPLVYNACVVAEDMHTSTTSSSTTSSTSSSTSSTASTTSSTSSTSSTASTTSSTSSTASTTSTTSSTTTTGGGG